MFIIKQLDTNYVIKNNNNNNNNNLKPLPIDATVDKIMLFVEEGVTIAMVLVLVSIVVLYIIVVPVVVPVIKQHVMSINCLIQCT
jgi:hypothetical protein